MIEDEDCGGLTWPRRRSAESLGSVGCGSVTDHQLKDSAVVPESVQPKYITAMGWIALTCGFILAAKAAVRWQATAGQLTLRIQEGVNAANSTIIGVTVVAPGLPSSVRMFLLLLVIGMSATSVLVRRAASRAAPAA